MHTSTHGLPINNNVKLHYTVKELAPYQGKRLRFWTADEDGEHQRIGTLSVRKDTLRLDWEEHFPKGSITYFRTLDPRIISVLDPAPANSGADFDFMDVLAVRRPQK